MKLPLDLLLHKITCKYNLKKIVVSGWIYIEIQSIISKQTPHKMLISLDYHVCSLRSQLRKNTQVVAMPPPRTHLSPRVLKVMMIEYIMILVFGLIDWYHDNKLRSALTHTHQAVVTNLSWCVWTDLLFFLHIYLFWCMYYLPKLTINWFNYFHPSLISGFIYGCIFLFPSSLILLWIASSLPDCILISAKTDSWWLSCIS